MSAPAHGLLTSVLPCPTPVFRLRESEHALTQAQPVRVSGLAKDEAEDLLDWLEATGHSGMQLSYEDGAGFTVLYR